MECFLRETKLPAAAPFCSDLVRAPNYLATCGVIPRWFHAKANRHLRSTAAWAEISPAKSVRQMRGRDSATQPVLKDSTTEHKAFVAMQT